MLSWWYKERWTSCNWDGCEAHAALVCLIRHLCYCSKKLVTVMKIYKRSFIFKKEYENLRSSKHIFMYASDVMPARADFSVRNTMSRSNLRRDYITFTIMQCSYIWLNLRFLSCWFSRKDYKYCIYKYSFVNFFKSRCMCNFQLF